MLRSATEDIRIERVYNFAIFASRVFINTCFRRGDIVSKTRYQVFAALASIIPLFDELPAFIGREKVRQVIGVHDNSALKNRLKRTKDSLREYLTAKKLKVPETYLKSGYFGYLTPKKREQTTTSSNVKSNKYIKREPIYHVQNKTSSLENASLVGGHAVRCVAEHGFTTAGVVLNVTDDVLRVTVPGSAVALRAVSIAGIVAGVVLTPVFAAWTFYYTGKRINKHLHRLCDDLVIILAHFLFDVCNDCCRSIQLSIHSSADTDSSLSDDE